MHNFHWDTIGTGKINLILLNGWGINSNIWMFIIKQLQYDFKFYLIDLPGSGKNKNLLPEKIDTIIKILYKKMPKNAIWIGWSIGGLIVNYFALCYPQHALALINVASSPCFIEKKNWPGIKKHIIHKFYYNLKTKYHQTINTFLDIEQINSKKHSKDISILKKIFYQSPPHIELLNNGLEIIFLFDLRVDMAYLKIPILRIYGELDNLIPKKIASILDSKWPRTHSIIIKKAAHAPFITNKNQFCSILLNFKKSLLK
ncbi:pimeloyl-ACP methyl ester esterase BioH [Buchnera aphidicola]|uniref:Pimeloyl-[acyl-carrier protein] methyl ester esterase n=1 Tax=Buchnera aphidicola str. Ua (Uroleucon ambrosiae) TaxID=1005057 RepID=G2LQ25_BUCUM|nr:pimeloyl-ACP methyl ester esterase BioH [Buchnera aphidicola]AEO08312.1 carboxylesterase [Buchnera aphidicola str. Ua (Uroleucon ambrosiae)]